VLRKRVAVLVAAAVMMLSMFVVSAPVFAQECDGASCELNPGNTEASRSIHTTPPQSKFGSVARNPEANEHDTNNLTGRGKRA
jgi:ABC-type sulfate transport system permease component